MKNRLPNSDLKKNLSRRASTRGARTPLNPARSRLSPEIDQHGLYFFFLQRCYDKKIKIKPRIMDGYKFVNSYFCGVRSLFLYNTMCDSRYSTMYNTIHAQQNVLYVQYNVFTITFLFFQPIAKTCSMLIFFS